MSTLAELRDVESAVEKMKAAYEEDDSEVSHGYEDDAMLLIVDMAAENHPDTAAAARLFLSVYKPDAGRWYA